jgi:MerR family transcriptional regulator, redox-sensitive transcriptional activator SoxR
MNPAVRALRSALKCGSGQGLDLNAVAEFPELTIGEVARRAGVATSSIRYYERIGLLPAPERTHGQRRYGTDVLGKLGFIGVAQGAGFRLAEIRELIDGVDSPSGMAEPMRSLSSQKLDEIEALLERTKAMKGWLEVARECGCATPSECALFPAPGEEPVDAESALRLVQVDGAHCRRP